MIDRIEFGSLEVYYTYQSAANKSIELITNIQGVRQFNVGPETYEDISVIISSIHDVYDDVFIRIETMLGTTMVDQSDFSTYTSDASVFVVRIFFFNQFVSVSLNDKWVYSYAFANISYSAADTTAALKLNGTATFISAIRKVELSDGREAVFVDYESNTESAIQSIIQQRPVMILPHVNRKLSFTYDAEKDTVPASFVSDYNERISHPSSLSSDGLVYGRDVGVSIDLQVAEDVGFITKLYRLPELDTGANEAAAALQRRARQQRTGVTVQQRFDPRIEVTDVLHVDLVVTGTNRQIDRLIIVEDVRVSLRDGEYSMSIVGRKKA